MAQIVSASVGRAAAGEVVIPEPRSAAYATWPDVIKHGIDAIGAIYRDKINARGEDPDDLPAPITETAPTAPRAPAATPMLAGGMGLLVLGALGFLLLRRGF